MRDLRGCGAIERCVAAGMPGSANRHRRHAWIVNAKAACVRRDVFGRETAAELEECDTAAARVDSGEAVLTLQRGDRGMRVASRRTAVGAMRRNGIESEHVLGNRTQLARQPHALVVRVVMRALGLEVLQGHPKCARELFRRGVEDDVVSSAGNFGDGESVRVREVFGEKDAMVARIVPLRQFISRENRTVGGVHRGAHVVRAPVSRAQHDGHLKRQVLLDGAHRCGTEGMGDSASSDTSTDKFAH